MSIGDSSCDGSCFLLLDRELAGDAALDAFELEEQELADLAVLAVARGRASAGLERAEETVPPCLPKALAFSRIFSMRFRFPFVPAACMLVDLSDDRVFEKSFVVKVLEVRGLLC